MDEKKVSEILGKYELSFPKLWKEFCEQWDYQPEKNPENEAGLDYQLRKYQELTSAMENNEVEIFLKGLRREGGYLADSGTTLEDLLTGTAIYTEIIYNIIINEIKDSAVELLTVSREMKNLSSKIFLESSLGFEVAKDAVIEDQRAELEHLVVTDPLTGLYNHSYIYHQLKIETLRSERYKHKLVVLLADIDDFKVYNDVHGHIKGDEVIRKIASIMFEESRASDLVGRYAGEEFVVLLPETGDEAAKKYAERVHKAINKTNFFGMETQPAKKITLSIGYAVFPENANNVDELLHQADLAVDKAKAQEGNGISGP